MDTQDLQRHLRQFTGSECWYRHNLNRNTIYTDGVQFFAENAGAYWFIDIVATELHALQRDDVVPRRGEHPADLMVAAFLDGQPRFLLAEHFQLRR